MKRASRVLNRYVAVVFIGCLYSLVLLIAVWKPNPVDDAYITFTYARNLVEGHGLVFTPGERVFGSSTPLYALLLGILAFPFGTDAIPRTALCINALCLAATSALCYATMAKMDNRYRLAGAIVALLVATNASCLLLCVSGMEALMLTALVLASFLALLFNREVLCGVLLGLAILTRPEGALAAMVSAAAWWALYRRIPWRMAVGAIVVTLPWVVSATLYFGSPVPHSILVKLRTFHHYDGYPTKTMVQLLGEIDLLLGVSEIKERVLNSPLLATPLGATFVMFPAAMFSCMLVLLCAVMWAKRCRESLLFTGFAILYVAFFAWGNKLYFHWYGVPLIPFEILILAGGITGFCHWIIQKKPLSRRWRVFATILILSVGAIPAVRFHWQFLTNTIPTWTLHNLRAGSAREGAYRKAAEFLNARGGPSDGVGLPEVGAFGFYTKQRPVDLVGLVTKEVMPLRLRGQGYWTITEELKPAWIVTRKSFLAEEGPRTIFPYHLILDLGDVQVFERQKEKAQALTPVLSPK